MKGGSDRDGGDAGCPLGRWGVCYFTGFFPRERVDLNREGLFTVARKELLLFDTLLILTLFKDF